MYQTVYSSLAKQEFAEGDLKKLLITARILNSDVDVTGMLIFSDGVFLQALEGEQAAVQSIFDRIAKDPRHHQLQVIHQGSTLGKRRRFGEWSMGFSDAAGVARLLKGFVGLNEKMNLSELDEAAALDVLKACAQK